MMLLLTVFTRGGQRSVRLDEVVGATLPPLTPSTYLACRPKKRDGRGEMEVSNSAVRGGGGIRRRSWREVMKSSCPFFACTRKLAHFHGRTSACERLPLLAVGRDRNKVGSEKMLDLRVPFGPCLEGDLTRVPATT
jgi:hypothetical protein